MLEPILYASNPSSKSFLAHIALGFVHEISMGSNTRAKTNMREPTKEKDFLSKTAFHDDK